MCVWGIFTVTVTTCLVSGGGCHSVTWMISSKVSVTTRMLLTIVAKRKCLDNQK